LESVIEHGYLAAQYRLVHPELEPLFQVFFRSLFEVYRLQEMLTYFAKHYNICFAPSAYYSPHLASKECTYRILPLAYERILHYNPTDLKLWEFHLDEDLTKRSLIAQRRVAAHVVTQLDKLTHDVAALMSLIIRYKPTELDNDYIDNSHWNAFELVEEYFPKDENLMFTMLQKFMHVRLSYDELWCDVIDPDIMNLCITLDQFVRVPLISVNLTTVISTIREFGTKPVWNDNRSSSANTSSTEDDI